MSGGVRWLVDGNNVYGSRPDGWWNDRSAAATRFAQRVAEWCRTHGDDVTIVFDAPVAPRRGRDAADDHIVDLAVAAGDGTEVRVVTSDRGLRRRLPGHARTWGVGRFRELIGY